MKEMKDYIPHRILLINDQIEQKAQDECFMHSMRLAFQWANDMGLKGKRVFGLFLESPSLQNYNPLIQHNSLWCKIECSEEERQRWEEIRKLQAEQAVYDMLKDD